MAGSEEDERPHHAELYRSADLLVRGITGFSHDALVVTFDSYTDHRDPHTNYRHLDRPGFGEHFLRDRGVDAIHVIGRENNWYQYSEMPDATAAIAKVARGYQRTMTYGSSMGGYAAIRYGGVVGAERALAISPQFSVDPAVVPFDQRWEVEAQQIDFALERGWAPPYAATSYILYDPRNLDRRHVALFAKRSIGIVPVPLPGSGHSCALFLANCGLLQQAVLDVAHGTFDPAALRQAAQAFAPPPESGRARGYGALLRPLRPLLDFKQ
jgi:pimeloyl-ACP methyl ester carboxylesterase